eukprot:4144669-Pleurochrysis_carterae.AAC.1
MSCASCCEQAENKFKAQFEHQLRHAPRPYLLTPPPKTATSAIAAPSPPPSFTTVECSHPPECDALQWCAADRN